MLGAEDVIAIHDLISLYGYIIDERALSRTGELFTEDALYDVSDFKSGTHRGVNAITTLWAGTDRHPLAHHATNVIVRQDDDGTVRVISKGIGVLPDGAAGSVTYKDIVVNTPKGWRIRERVAIRRRADRIPANS